MREVRRERKPCNRGKGSEIAAGPTIHHCLTHEGPAGSHAFEARLYNPVGALARTVNYTTIARVLMTAVFCAP